MSINSERLLMLEMIGQGVINANEGVRLLKALEGEADAGVETSASPVAEIGPAGNIPAALPGENQPGQKAVTVDQEVSKWRRWWMIPMWAGISSTVLGGVLMFWALQASGMSFWFACAWLPFLLGVGLMLLAWSSRLACWLHIRVHQKHGERPENIAISFPIPIRLTSWFLRNFGHRIPKLEKTGIDKIILALSEKTSPETPFYLEVDEGKDGETVQIYIG